MARSIRLFGNPLMPEAMEQLEVYHQRTGWSFGIILPDRTVPEHDHKRLVAQWFPPGLASGEKARRTRQWDLLRREGRVAETFSGSSAT